MIYKKTMCFIEQHNTTHDTYTKYFTLDFTLTFECVRKIKNTFTKIQNLLLI